jgi:hypothetical protein
MRMRIGFHRNVLWKLELAGSADGKQQKQAHSLTAEILDPDGFRRPVYMKQAM